MSRANWPERKRRKCLYLRPTQSIFCTQINEETEPTSMSNHGSGNKFVYALQEYSIPLLMGVVVAMLMANLMPDLYHTIVHDTLSLVTGESADHVAATAPCLLYTSPSPRDRTRSRMPSSA